MLIISVHGNPPLCLVFVFVGPWKTRKTKVDFRKHLQHTVVLTSERQLDLESNSEFNEIATSGPGAAPRMARGRIVYFCANPSLATI